MRKSTVIIHSFYFYSRIYIAMPLLLALSACSSLSTHQTGIIDHPVNIDVSYVGRETASFTGKGAGAGMMMMSSMGPMGIAIGVAIDEGIAKDIHDALRQQETNIATRVESVFSRALKENQIELDELHIDISRYGFKTYAAPEMIEQEDPVAAWLEFKVVATHQREDGSKNEQVVELRYPEGVEGVVIKTLPLEKVKRDGKASTALLMSAIETVASSWAETIIKP